MTAVGLWAARLKGNRQVTAWHRIESEIASRYITKCGREMERETKRGNLFTAAFVSGQACTVCQP